MRVDRRPVSQLHSADNLPELMRRAMRSLVRAEELATDPARVSDAEREALRAGLLDLVRRYVVQLRDAGEPDTCIIDRLRDELNDPLVPCDLRCRRAALIGEAEQRIAEVFALAPA